MDRVRFDYSKLKGRIREKFGTQMIFSKEVGLSAPFLSNKLNCNFYFSQNEILKIAKALDIQPEEFAAYFFTPTVQKVEQ